MTVLQVDKGCYADGNAKALIKVTGGVRFDYDASLNPAQTGYYKVSGNKQMDLEAKYEAVTGDSTLVTNPALMNSGSFEYLFTGLGINNYNFTVEDAKALKAFFESRNIEFKAINS